MKYRNNGAIGAILDEYEKSLKELLLVIQSISNENLIQILDSNTQDEDCKSIQTILTHVIHSGYVYVVEIKKWLGETCQYKEKEFFNNIDEYSDAIHKMFCYNEKLFKDYPHIQLNEFDPNLKIKTRWGQLYDVDQLFEHAIVHVLRHRRQIERFIVKLKENSK